MTWVDVPLFTVGNYGVSSRELAARARTRLREQMIAEGRLAGVRSRRAQGKCEQLTLEV